MKTCSTLLLLCVLILPAFGQDGHIYDPGLEMTQRSAAAPEALDQAAGLVGQWAVALTTYPTDSTTHTATGKALVHYMNRGHGLTERLQVPDFDGTGFDLHQMGFLIFNPASTQWGYAEASNYTERGIVYNGTWAGGALVLHTVQRRLGGLNLTHYRVTFANLSKDGFTYTLARSTDDGQTWTPQLKKTYTRQAPAPNFWPNPEGFGTPAPDRAAEADGFDFMVGTWQVAHNMTFPNGQTAQWPANGTAVYVLGGAAVMEYNWFDVDPNWPEAATTILRIYNRAERRWENLYFPNRGHSILYFGGRQEGDRIVLTNFETHTADPRLSHYVFHSIEQDRYQWYGENTTDRGRTWTKFWTIDITRK